MLAIKSWRIYYADGSTFTDKDGTWAEAPPFGVQCIVYYHVPPYKTMEAIANDESIYYYLGDDDGKEYKGIKFGLWMDKKGFYRIMDRAGKSTPENG